MITVYVLKYCKRNVNKIIVCFTVTLSIILFIILDYSLLNATNNTNYKRNVYTATLEIPSIETFNSDSKSNRSTSINRASFRATDLKDTLLETMQIADIYDENTRIEEVEGTQEQSEDTEELDISEILDKENPWRVKIPKINIDAPIKSGTSQDILALAVGHFPETTKWNGNVALAGHNRGYRCNFFQEIKKLEEGDEIIYSTDYGERKYKVIVNKIIHQTDWSYIQDTEDNRITLITCVENMHDYRRCVQAVEI